MSDNPKWKPLLDAIPQEFHAPLKEQLVEWDKGIQQAFDKIHQEYEPLKPYKDVIVAAAGDGIKPEHIGQSLDIFGQIQSDPKAFALKLNDVYELKLIGQQAAPVNDSGSGTDDEIPEEFQNLDFMKHPVFKQMYDKLEQMNNQMSTREQQEQTERETEQFYAWLDEQDEKFKPHGGINKTFVTALMTQGMDGDDAIKAYFTEIGKTVDFDNLDQNSGQGQVDDNPPGVMGSAGQSGAGLPDNSFDVTKLNSEETEKLVMDMLSKANEG